MAVSAAVLALAGACDATGSPISLDDVRDRAAADHGWDVAAIEVDVLGDLARGGCQFYRASNPRVLDAWAYTYAQLPSGELAGPASPATAASVIRECAGNARAGWLAQVVTEFSGEVPGLVVDADSAGSSPRLIEEAGFDYFPPRTSDGSVTFYVRNFDAGSIHLVAATLPDDGDLEVTISQVVAPR